MPMCDAYLPQGALDPETERKLVARLTDLLVEHELRRITDLLDDPDAVKASRDRARAIAWVFVHRTDTYVAGELSEAPHYKFQASIPEGQIDDVFRAAIVRDITDAVSDAENGKWPYVEARVWVLTYEVPNGYWGGGGQPVHLRQIVDYVAPGLGEAAEERFADKRRAAAAETVALAGAQGATA